MSRSTPPPSSLEDGTHDANGEKPCSHEPSAGTSSPVDGALENPELSEDNVPAAEEKATETPAPPPMMYPKGIQLVSIMASLVLTIGMMSLDSVTFTSPSSRIIKQSPSPKIPLRW